MTIGIILSYIGKYWKYLLIGVLLIGIYYYYNNNKLLHASVASLENSLHIQHQTIKAYQSQYQDTLKALQNKETIIVSLQQQIETMDVSIEEIIEEDEEARSWAEELYNPAIINRVVYTPIKVE